MGAVSISRSLVNEVQLRSGLSQAELGRRAGLSRSVVNAYIRGNREPGAGTLARIAAAAGFELDLVPRRPPVDEDRAAQILVQVLELAEELPYRPRRTLEHPPLPRLSGTNTPRT